MMMMMMMTTRSAISKEYHEFQKFAVTWLSDCRKLHLQYEFIIGIGYLQEYLID